MSCVMPQHINDIEPVGVLNGDDHSKIEAGGLGYRRSGDPDAMVWTVEGMAIVVFVDVLVVMVEDRDRRRWCLPGGGRGGRIER